MKKRHRTLVHYQVQIQSMSDLTAIVAESVESYARTCANAKEENERLQAELEATRRAALSVARYSGTMNITGQGGLPVYAFGHFKDAVFNGRGFEPSDSDEGNPVCKFCINLRNITECKYSQACSSECAMSKTTEYSTHFRVCIP